MNHTPSFGKLLCSIYGASGSKEPLERFFASMFASYYDQTDSQPNCAAVKDITRGVRPVPRKLLQFYRDTEQPRCPRKLAEDLTALAECCFAEASSRNDLADALEVFLQRIPAADAEDLSQILSQEDLLQRWTCVTWYALCGDHYG